MSLQALRRTVLAGIAATLSVVALVAAPAAASTVPQQQELCGEFDSVAVENGKYVVQNNVWGASTAQCIQVNGASFRVTTADHNNATNGAPAAYPSIFAGCHYRNCSTNSGLPKPVSSLGSPRASWSTSSPADATYNVSFDLWFDPNPSQPAQNAGELMIWLKRQGDIQPIGSPVGTANIAGATWEVWTGSAGWNVISYLRTEPTDSVSNLDLAAFTNDAVARGSIGQSWNLTSVQAGFEPWKGGVGLSTNSFSFTAG